MSKFHNDSNILYTNALFKELDLTESGTAMYTLGFEDLVVDGKTYISIRKAYLELEDPTEYVIAEKYFQSWAHWKKVRQSTRIRPHIDEWREELEVRMRSRGLQGIMAKVYDGDYQASKYLADKGWVPKGERKRGAPSASEKVAVARKEAKVIGLVDSHWERMNKKER